MELLDSMHANSRIGRILKEAPKAVECGMVPVSPFHHIDTIVDDLSELRNSSPVLLTRGMTRCYSSPCIAPRVGDASPEVSRPLELLDSMHANSHMRRMLKEASKAVECGMDPEAATGGLGGAYYFKNREGQNIAIIKPIDEEPFAHNNPNGYVGRTLGQPGLKRTIRVGEAGPREVAAYLLDHDGFASVPPTSLVKASHSIFHVNGDDTMGGGERAPAKIASFQQYVQHDFDASEHGTSRFPVSAVHRIGILDIRIFNTDRHSGIMLGSNWNLSIIIPDRIGIENYAKKKRRKIPKPMYRCAVF